MRFITFIERAFKAFLPTPFTIALLLTLLTVVLAATLTSSDAHGIERVIELADFWQKGLWESSLLVFAMQMMLMLVLGHALALTKPVDAVIRKATGYCTTTAKAAAIVTVLTILVALFNWGLGLIFGAILARKVGEHALRNGLDLNYPLIGAAGYSGLMVWHGGISGSAPIKVAEDGHLKDLLRDIASPDELSRLPENIDFSSTIFGSMNLTAMVFVVLILPLFMYLLGRRLKGAPNGLQALKESNPKHRKEENSEVSGAEKLDHSNWLSLAFGLAILLVICYLTVSGFKKSGLGFINPNYINLLLFALCLLLHKNIRNFLAAIDEAIGGAAGILIQFPLYFGIMGIMTHSGLVQVFSDFFVGISNGTTFPIFTFFSAGIVNVFVPSGGGQWGVQGPIIIQAAMELGVSLPKSIMALAYGDQLTNMLQPFWALPLLGITGLKASSILPYTVALMGAGTLIFLTVLLLF